MKDESLYQIEKYLAEHYISPEWLEEKKKQGWKFSLNMRLGDAPSEIGRTESIIRILKDKIGLAGNYFSDYLFKLIKDKNLTDVEVYKKAHLDRRIFSKIRNEKDYMPSKRTILAIAIALELDFKETNTLLERAGYYLSKGRKEDVIIGYFIENQIYDIFLINEVLDHYGFKILGE